MKNGDSVTVTFADGETIKGELLAANVTIKTERGGTMNGPVDVITTDNGFFGTIETGGKK